MIFSLPDGNQFRIHDPYWVRTGEFKLAHAVSVLTSVDTSIWPETDSS